MRIPVCLCAFIVATTLFAEAQESATLYYSSQWELTTKDSAQYYRICKIELGTSVFVGEVRDFTMNGQLLMEGFYKNGTKNGEFTSYYTTGQIESRGKFVDDFRSGIWMYYYPNGKLLRRVEFFNTLPNEFVVAESYDPEGNPVIQNGTGEWVYEYEWYRIPSKLVVKGQFLKGKKEGEWTCGLVNGIPLYREIFKNGKLRQGFYTKPDGSNKEEYTTEMPNKFLPPFKHEVIQGMVYRGSLTRKDYPFLSFLPLPFTPITPNMDSTGSDGKIFLVVEQPPEFTGGLEAMYKFITKNLQYPASARKMQIEGSVFVVFIVDTDGAIREASVLKGVSEDCNNEALRVVKLMPNWRPGTQQGKPVRVKYVLPIKFRLEGAPKGTARSRRKI